MSTAPAQIPIRVSATAPNATRVDLTVRTFSLVCDEPPERHGNNEGMLPLEAFLSGYVACTNVIMNIIAREMGITFSGLTFHATGYLDPRGYTGALHLPAPFTRLRLQISGKATGATDKLDDLKSQLRWRCPAAATFISAGTEVTEDWELEIA